MKKVLLIVTLAIAPVAQAATLDFKKEGAICDTKAVFCADHMMFR